jgi:hypothetical protein
VLFPGDLLQSLLGSPRSSRGLRSGFDACMTLGRAAGGC